MSGNDAFTLVLVLVLVGYWVWSMYRENRP